MKLKNIIVSASFMLSNINAGDTLDEYLNIYKYQNNWSLLEFNYVFTKTDEDEANSHSGLYPAQF